MIPTRIAVGLTILLTLSATALAGTYTSGGTFVVKTQFGTVLDNGGVVCQGDHGDGVGGGCLLFPENVGRGDDGTLGGGFVRVSDASAAGAVAFQVCIDNNGDGICGGPGATGGSVGADDPAGALSPQSDPACFDQIFFSHDDEGRFFNALGPLPTTFLRGCEGNGGFPGYVVLLCTGAHEVGGSSHTHALTTGSISLATEGSGYGTFCGGGFGGGAAAGNVNAAAKAYRVI